MDTYVALKDAITAYEIKTISHFIINSGTKDFKNNGDLWLKISCTEISSSLSEHHLISESKTFQNTQVLTIQKTLLTKVVRHVLKVLKKCVLQIQRG